MESAQALAANGKCIKYYKNGVDDVFACLDQMAEEIIAE